MSTVDLTGYQFIKFTFTLLNHTSRTVTLDLLVWRGKRYEQLEAIALRMMLEAEYKFEPSWTYTLIK